MKSHVEKIKPKFVTASDPEINKALSGKDIQSYSPRFKTVPRFYHADISAKRMDVKVLRIAVFI